MSVLAQDAGALLLGAKTALTAAASAALVLVAAARSARAEPVRPWGAPLALAAAVATGFWVSRGRPSLPPTQAMHWIFYAALAGGAYGAFEAASGHRSRLARAALSVLLPVVLLEFQRARHWGRVEGMLWTAALAALLFASWSTLAALEERKASSAALALGLALAMVLSAAAFRFAGGSLFTLLPVSLALALGASALFGFRRRTSGLGAAGVAPFVLLHFGLLWVARWLYALSTPGFVLLSLVPLAASLSLVAPALRTRTRAAVELLGPTLCAAAALAFEWWSAPAPSSY